MLFSLQSYDKRYDIDVDDGECYFIYASCKDVLITSLIIPGIVVLSAYVFGCYIFRFVFPENLATLTEKVHNYYIMCSVWEYKVYVAQYKKYALHNLCAYGLRG